MGRAFRRTGHPTRDSALAFFVNQLENLDRRLYMPLVEVSWSRDIKLRSGITMSDETTSFIQSTFAAPGGLANTTGHAGGNMPWVSPQTTAIPGVNIDGQKVVTPLRLLAREVSYTSRELALSQRLGQPIDVQKMNAFNILYQMNTDQMVYVGDQTLGSSVTGLINNSSIATGTVVEGVSGLTPWIDKTPDEILADVNSLLESTWANSGFAVCPSDLLIPPVQFSQLASRKVSSAGNLSILKFLKENSISLAKNGKELNIQPVKWLTGAGTESSDRMVAYTNDEIRVRFPMVPAYRETAYYMGMRYFAPYAWLFGQMEFPYPETLQYADGI